MLVWLRNYNKFSEIPIEGISTKQNTFEGKIVPLYRKVGGVKTPVSP